MGATGCELVCEVILAILLPPLGVCLRHGCCSTEFLICLLLTILGYIPGIIYALYTIIFLNNRNDAHGHHHALVA